MNPGANILRKSSTAPARRHAVAPRIARLAFFQFLALLSAVVALSLSSRCHANSGTGGNQASASINFRIDIPAIIRVTPVAQRERIVIAQRDIDQGYIDLDAGTSLKLTNNTHDGYLLTASYNAQLLSAVEVRVANQRLTASAGGGSMRVISGLLVDKLVDIGYRLHLAPGVRAGEYQWPVALSFSLAHI